jgi:hypothetical protein
LNACQTAARSRWNVTLAEIHLCASTPSRVSLAETRGDSSVDAIPCVPTIDPSTFNSLSRSRGGPSRQHGEESEPETQPLIDRHLDLLNFILTTPAKGLRGAQIKLRVLLNPMAGMAAGRGIHDITAVRDVSKVISRELVDRRRARQQGRAKP